ncbi:MAG: insulinase family protein [Candidatus Cloacimonetes bacterium]|nr:insulinase family protein [Candidatus Cloacimonadota bacterium]
MKVISKKLPNQFKIIMAKDSSNPLVCIQLYVRVGSVWEEEAQAGFSHLTEHLIFKSTKLFPNNVLMNRVTDLGGYINAYTEFDSTCFYITLPAIFAEEALEILSELAFNANFSEVDFVSEKKVVIEELKQFKDEPEDSFIEEVAADYFEDNPYKKPIIGNLNSIKQCKADQIRSFYKHHYTPNNCFLVVSGDLKTDEFLKISEKYFSKWEQVPIERKKRLRNSFPTKPEIKYFPKSISGNLIAFVLPDLSESDPEAYPLSLAVKAFAIGKNSRLYDRLFNHEKLVDSVHVHSLSGIHDGASVINVMAKKRADVTKISSIFLEELEYFYLHGINDIELEDNKRELIFFYRYSFEYMESLASSLGSEEILSNYEKFFEYPEMVRNITKIDVNRVINSYFKKEQLKIYFKGKAEPNIKQLFTIIEKKYKKYKNIESTVFETKLDNGIKIFLKKVMGKPTVGISLAYEVSQLNESEKNLGINFLTSALMLYGNEKRNYQQFLNYCTSNGINFSINPHSETTLVSAKCFKETLSASLDLIAEVVLKPTFPKEHFHNLKTTAKSSLDRLPDYPQYLSANMFKHMMFGKKSNLINRSGSKSSINKLTLKQVKDWYNKHYNPGNMSISIVGDFNFEETLRICNSKFGSKNNGSKRGDQKAIISSSESRFKFIKKGLDQAYITIGGFGCTTLEKEKSTAFHILSQIIGGDSDSILFRELREKRGLAYSVGFNFSSTRSVGFWAATAVVDRSKQNEAVEVICNILENVKKNGFSPKDLQTTKNYIRGQRLIEEESILNQAQVLSMLEAIDLGYAYYKKRDERLEKVNVKMLHKLAAEYFKIENRFIHILA